MAKRKADELDSFEEDTFSKVRNSDNGDYDDDGDDDDDYGSDDGKKYEIMKEDDIEGQEVGEITNDGEVQITPFNMKEEMEEGHFDANGMYHWNKETNIRDNWLENIDWVKIKEKDGDTDKPESDSEDESRFDETASYKQILQYMKEGETVATALRRLAGSKSVSALERLKMKKAGISFDKNNMGNKEAVTKLTELADSILSNRGNMDIYQETYEQILNKLNQKVKIEEAAARIPDLDMYADDFDEKEKAGLSAVPSTPTGENDACSSLSNSETDILWEFKKELTDEKIEGPYSTQQMNKWVHEDYFKTQVWVRKVGSESEFSSSKRIDFELYL